MISSRRPSIGRAKEKGEEEIAMAYKVLSAQIPLPLSLAMCVAAFTLGIFRAADLGQPPIPNVMDQHVAAKNPIEQVAAKNDVVPTVEARERSKKKLQIHVLEGGSCADGLLSHRPHTAIPSWEIPSSHTTTLSLQGILANLAFEQSNSR